MSTTQIRFGNAVQFDSESEENQETAYTATAQRKGRKERRRAAPVVSPESGTEKHAPHALRTLKRISDKANARFLRLNQIKKLFNNLTVDGIAGFLDFFLNSLYIIGLITIGFYMIRYIAQGNVVMTLSCAAVLWIMKGLGDNIGRKTRSDEE